MDLAVRTAASPAAIWVIVIVMSIMTAILVSAASVADSWQTRAGRRARGAQRLGAAVGDLINHDGALGPDKTSSGVPQSGRTVPGEAWSQTRDGAGTGEPGLGGERMSRGPVPGQPYANEQQRIQPLLPPEEEPAVRPRAADPAAPPEPEGAKAKMAETITEAEAPTRSDLPPVPGRAAMPTQRRADADRTEQSPTGTTDRAGPDPGQP